MVDIPFGPSVADYATCLTDDCEVTNLISGKQKNLKDYNVILIYSLICLPLTKNTVFEGPLGPPKVTDSLFKLRSLAKKWVQAITQARTIRSDFHQRNVFEPLLH